MNNIVFAGGREEKLAGKYLEIAVPDGGEITVIPPLCADGGEAGGVHVYIEQAVLGARQTFTLPDVINGGIRHAAAQAAAFFGKDGKNRAVLSALGDLLVSYVTLYADGGKNLSPATVSVQKTLKRNVSNSAFYIETELKKLPLNYDYVRKLFKKEVGETPHAYLLRLRMELAAQFLTSGITNRYSKYTVSQIAEACGFAEPLYFSRVFKKYYGVSPSAYGKE